ncbi:unnamed protein product, partial [marine sediment metagenome]
SVDIVGVGLDYRTKQKLSDLVIDVDKNWNAKSISNMTQISVGDILFANGWRLTETENGIALVDDKEQIIRRWTNV